MPRLGRPNAVRSGPRRWEDPLPAERKAVPGTGVVEGDHRGSTDVAKRVSPTLTHPPPRDMSASAKIVPVRPPA